MCAPPAGAAIVVQMAPSPGVDLAIRDATVLNVRSGRSQAIDSGTARAVVARRTIEARGRVVTPGVFDVHSHSGMVLGDSVTPTNGYITHLVMRPDSIAAYRRRYAEMYLPYGVTSVRDVGSEERDMPMLLAWMRRSADAPDFYPVGAQFISPEPGRVPPPFQIALADSAAAAAQVRRYYALGIRDIKLYWRLNRPAFDGALAAALALGMRPDGHVGDGTVRFRRLHASLTPTLRIEAQRLGLTYVQSAPRIPMAGVFAIATINGAEEGAEEVGQASAVGAVEVGKRADLILFDRNPFDQPSNLLGPKTVIKSGVVWCRK